LAILPLFFNLQKKEVVELFDRDEPIPSFETELHVVRLGDAVLAMNPFELYQDFGLRIKARSPAAQTIVVQLAAGTGFYLPTERAVQGGITVRIRSWHRWVRWYMYPWRKYLDALGISPICLCNPNAPLLRVKPGRNPCRKRLNRTEHTAGQRIGVAKPRDAPPSSG